MNTNQIAAILNNYNGFAGVFERDHVPKFARGKLYVINTDECTRPGEHWLTVYYTPSGNKEFFDSYAQLPSYYGFRGQFTYGRMPLQGLLSQTCGQYCVAYATYRLKHKYSMKHFLSEFTEDTVRNDIAVHQFVEENFNLNLPLFF